MKRRPRSRSVLFVVLLTTLLAGAAGYVGWAALRGQSSVVQAKNDGAAAIRDEPHVVFQDVRGRAGDDVYAHVGLAPADSPARARFTSDLVCERVYFAAGRGLCLKTVSMRRLGDLVLGQAGFKATITGPSFEPRHDVRLAGIPSRARISPDGRYGATTVFVTGHSYAENSFSTQTLLIDMERGTVLADLEKDFTVFRDGQRIKEVDFNFWGVTFARRPGRFYATLGTGGKTYLLEGDVRARRARVLDENVECPSISPDNKRLAYKKRVGNAWRLHVLDLKTMQEKPLAEERPIDDQVEWLDDDRVLYGLAPDTWVVPADGGGAPRRFLSRALSPAVVRD